jgi:glycosyltransferase involved in cell wall biosynthesis
VKGLPHDLVLAGPARRTKALRKLIRELGIESRVKRLGYVPEAKLPALYAAADLLLFPSKAEGFGFPVLEAMASGTPCVISKDEALRELAGGAAISVNVENLERLRGAVERVLLKPEAAKELRRKGIERAREFTWERTVDLTLEAYKEARERFEKD